MENLTVNLMYDVECECMDVRVCKYETKLYILIRKIYIYRSKALNAFLLILLCFYGVVYIVLLKNTVTLAQ